MEAIFEQIYTQTFMFIINLIKFIYLVGGQTTETVLCIRLT